MSTSAMTTLRALVLLCVAGTALCQTPCCWFDKWEALITQKLGVYNRVSNFASLADIESTISVDHSLQKTFNELKVKNGSSITYLQVLDDFANGKSYTLYNGYCIKGSLDKPMAKSCVPDGAVPLGSHSFAGFEADTWLVPAPAGQEDFTTTRATVSKKNCVPVHEMTLTFGDTSRMSLVNLENVTQGIRDPTVFDVPEICNNTQTLDSLIPLTEQSPHMRIVGQYIQHHRARVF